MYQRTINLLDSFSFFLFGARGTGKTSLLEGHFVGTKKPLLWLDLLDDDLVRLFEKSPKNLDSMLPKNIDLTGQWIVIDEVQKVPELLNRVHYLIEKVKINFALTGSSARKLKKEGINLLGGRAASFSLFPLSSRELGLDFDLQKALEWGTLPQIWKQKNDLEKYESLRAYVNIYLKEEIKFEQIVRKTAPFIRFLEVAAQMNGCIINASKIGRDAGVDSKAVERYYEILTDTLLGFELPPFDRSVRKRQSQKSKYFLFDTGIKRALDQTLKMPLIPKTSAYEFAFEHWIILELYKLNEYYRADFKFSYLRTKDDLEVDVIVKRPGKPLLLVDIKSSTFVDEQEIHKLRSIKSDLAPSELIVLSQDTQPRFFPDFTIYPWMDGLKKIFD